MQRLTRLRSRPSIALSESRSVTITPVGMAVGIITAIRVQDIQRQLWYDWDLGVGWVPGPPEVVPGTGSLYIAFYAINQELAGEMTLTITDDTGATLATKTVWVNAGAGDGVESGTIEMPNRSYGITLTVTP